MPLIEPDSIDQAFNRAVEVGIFKNYEGRFATELEREALVTFRSGGADGAAYFGRPSEGDFVDIGMIDQRLAG